MNRSAVLFIRLTAQQLFAFEKRIQLNYVRPEASEGLLQYSIFTHQQKEWIKYATKPQKSSISLLTKGENAEHLPPRPPLLLFMPSVVKIAPIIDPLLIGMIHYVIGKYGLLPEHHQYNILRFWGNNLYLVVLNLHLNY